MMNLMLFLAGVFVIVFFLGLLLEKVRIPWIFAAMLIGLGLAAKNPYKEITTSPEFTLLANLGMYFLLFIIGFELNLKEIKRKRNFIAKATFLIISAETIVTTLIVHFMFDVNWIVSFMVSASFATIGEAMLIPILDEFNMTKTKLGQTILGIGVLDDVVEIGTILAIAVLLGYTNGHTQINIWLSLLILFGLFGLAILMIKMKKTFLRFQYQDVHSFFLVIMFFIFLFVGLGDFVDSAALGALIAGIALKNIIPKKTLAYIESEITTLAYGFLAPIFFLWVGLDVDMTYLSQHIILILFFLLVTYIAKGGMSYLVAKKELGKKKAIVLGVALCVRFSTSVVVLKLLLVNNMISSHLYSIFIGMQVMSKLIIPFVLAKMITKWNIVKSPAARKISKFI